MMLVAKLGLQLALMPFRGLAVTYRLPNFKPLVLWVIQIQRIVVSARLCAARNASDLVHAYKRGTVSLNRVRSIKGVILSLGVFETVKLYKAWHLVEMTVADNQPACQLAKTAGRTTFKAFASPLPLILPS